VWCVWCDVSEERLRLLAVLLQPANREILNESRLVPLCLWQCGEVEGAVESRGDVIPELGIICKCTSSREGDEGGCFWSATNLASAFKHAVAICEQAGARRQKKVRRDAHSPEASRAECAAGPGLTMYVCAPVGA
jgi:hypothetical protein